MIKPYDYIYMMKTPSARKIGSFSDDQLSFSKKFHSGSAKIIAPPSQETFYTPSEERFKKAMLRKIAHAKQRLRDAQEEEEGPLVIGDIHEYQYRVSGDQPGISFSGVSLLLVTPILLRINLEIGISEGIPLSQYFFYTLTIAFLFNYMCILRQNHLYPFMPQKSEDNLLKLACLLIVMALFAVIYLGWNASGGMVLAILWQSLSGRQGCFYLIIFGAIVAGSVTMQWRSPQDYFSTIISSILFGIAQTLIHYLSKASPYTISHQLTLFLLLGSAALFPFYQNIELTLWQYAVLLVMGFSVYFNLLLWIKLMQTERVSMVMGVTSGIIVISATTFEEVSDYVACMTIVLSILVLLKIQYIDRK